MHRPVVAGPPPIVAVNMTPLIDVMLVLLIMFIITIPLQSHAVKLDLPRDCRTCPLPNPIRNVVAITASGAILWNGEPVDRDELRYVLAASQKIDPVPELHLKPEPEAPYAMVDEVLAMTKLARVRKMGFVGNERYRHF